MRLRRRLFLACVSILVSLAWIFPSALTTFEALHQFTGNPDGAVALGALVQGDDGNLYGTTQQGGQFGLGTVYRMTADGAIVILHHFTGADGSLPSAALVLASDGNFYGTTSGGGNGTGTVFRLSPSGAFMSLHSFANPFGSTGSGPYAPLVQGTDGRLYGVTFGGGKANCGTVFSITLAGAATTLHDFDNSAQGECSPFGGLTQAGDGRFYGTTRFGLIYRVSSAGDYAAVRHLNASPEGATLESALVVGNDGNLYGTAREGGPSNFGTIFKVTTGGTFTVVYAFTDAADGSAPDAGLVVGPDGNFYGTTVGAYGSVTGRRIFRMTPSGTLTPLHTFAAADTQPFSKLLVGSDGALYGTTNGGSLGFPGRSIAYRLTGVFITAGPPFGSFDTPADQLTVAGEVPVTGWALDNSGVAAVDIYRNPQPGEPRQTNGLVFIGSATFVEGARPDVAALYPSYPLSTRAGWGYMLLSNMFPNGGNGDFVLTAVARDSAGNATTLGQKRITVTNSTNTRPFGTIDTPVQGATVSGAVDNFGWALTPQPSVIPFDGSTITVYVDGVALGHPTYNLYRPDIAGLFPGYGNSNGAVGYFSLDTRALTNGVHILSWVVVDSNGHAQGIGSRYITVAN